MHLVGYIVRIYVHDISVFNIKKLVPIVSTCQTLNKLQTCFMTLPFFDIVYSNVVLIKKYISRKALAITL